MKSEPVKKQRTDDPSCTDDRKANKNTTENDDEEKERATTQETQHRAPWQIEKGAAEGNGKGREWEVYPNSSTEGRATKLKSETSLSHTQHKHQRECQSGVPRFRERVP